MNRPWMPFYVADYLADTTHLTTIEHGAYFLLIAHYWKNGCLPKDDKRLERIVRMGPVEWSEIKNTIAEFFEPGWIHRRIEMELAKTRELSAKRAHAARQKRAPDLQLESISSANDDEMQSVNGPIADTRARHAIARDTSHSHSQSQTESSSLRSDGSQAEAKPPKSRPVKSRLTPGWRLSDDMRAYAVSIGLTTVEIEREVENFRDYWTSRGDTKADWTAMWRMWARRSLDRRAPLPRGSPTRQTGMGLIAQLAFGNSTNDIDSDPKYNAANADPPHVETGKNSRRAP